MATSAWKIAAGVTCGILIAAGLLFGVLAVSCGLFVASVGENMAESQREKTAALAEIEFEDVEGEESGGYFRVEGYVRNTGDQAVSFVKVGVELLDREGNVLDTDWTYAVSGEALDPGGRKSFNTITPAPDGVTQFRYFVMPD